ncbi:hypothetical protein GGS26DRAFT_574387 [Hypomontagnella submonticulosa]|nr:hypothetical protein GGS26DRAFT_574387 [Hypomontagnella submonticulosa]
MDTLDIVKLTLPSPESLWSGVQGLIGSAWNSFVTYIQLPHVYWAIAVFAIVFTTITTLGMCMGFGPAGVLPGSLAAAFQSFAYGGFTPASGIFATLTSLAMLGLLNPAITTISALIALIPALFIFYTVQD